MKKAAILTLHGNHNYGNKLQNYALEHSVNSLGVEVSTIDFKPNIKRKNIIKRLNNPNKIIKVLVHRLHLIEQFSYGVC